MTYSIASQFVDQFGTAWLQPARDLATTWVVVLDGEVYLYQVQSRGRRDK